MRLLLHAHSTWSYDGTLSLDEWPRIAKAAGCDAVLFSEHEDAHWTPRRYRDYLDECQRCSRDGVTLVGGIEFEQEGRHLLCYGLRAWPQRPSTATELAGAVQAQGRSLCLAHPGKYQWAFSDSILEAVDAVEVWNSKWIYDGHLGPHPRSLTLARGKRLLVGQDVHKPKHVAAVFVDIDGNDPVAALERGDYRIVRGRRAWSPARLRAWRVVPALQRTRTVAMRTALTGYRLVRGLQGKRHG